MVEARLLLIISGVAFAKCGQTVLNLGELVCVLDMKTLLLTFLLLLSPTIGATEREDREARETFRQIVEDQEKRNNKPSYKYDSSDALTFTGVIVFCGFVVGFLFAYSALINKDD